MSADHNSQTVKGNEHFARSSSQSARNSSHSALRSSSSALSTSNLRSSLVVFGTSYGVQRAPYQGLCIDLRDVTVIRQHLERTVRTSSRQSTSNTLEQGLTIHSFAGARVNLPQLEG